MSQKAPNPKIHTNFLDYNPNYYSDFSDYNPKNHSKILDYPKFLILCNERPVGCVSCKKKEKKIYEIGCLCVIPEFQVKGIGTQAIEFVKEFYKDWEEFTLITPADKLENVKFYSEKRGFNIESTEKDENVKVVRLVLGKV